MIGRAIVLVREDQLSLAIGRKGQNVRLASKLCGWDIEIMTNDELEQQIERAVAGFMQIEGMTEELAQRLVEQGYLSYDDLSVIEPDALMEMGGMTEEQVNHDRRAGRSARRAGREGRRRREAPQEGRRRRRGSQCSRGRNTGRQRAAPAAASTEPCSAAEPAADCGAERTSCRSRARRRRRPPGETAG